MWWWRPGHLLPLPLLLSASLFPLVLASELPRPAQVVRWNGDVLDPQFPEEWQRIRGPIGTVCITGDDRVGKSTLLTLWGRNLTESQDFSFAAGHTRTSHTRGLWSALLPAELTGLEYHINLCDSQGLKQLPELEQWRLFSANVLLPSVMVYMLINVVQNDQLRDLARMAHQFQLLSSSDFNRFGSVLSPHLVVVIREESDLDEQVDADSGPQARNLNQHLETALSSPGFDEDKALIRQVFRTREAWSLQELPLEARRALRAAGGPPALGAGDGGTLESSRAWRESGEAVLEQVLNALDSAVVDLPDGGPQLEEWYRSVLETVNSREDGSLGRLVGHGELLAQGHRRRRWLLAWRGQFLLALAFLGLLFAFGGCVGRWLDRVAWCVWILLCVCHMGTCPLVTAPLSGIVPQICSQLAASQGGAFLQIACREASTHTAAMLLAAVLGCMSYPLLTAQFQWLLGLFPLPSALRSTAVGCCLALAVAVLGVLQDMWLESALDREVLLSAKAVLPVVAVLAAAELAVKLRRNRLRVRASERGRQLHLYVVERIEEVRRLQASGDWARHYRRHDARDSLWRYCREPVWQPTAVCCQACALLLWVYLIHPHSDPLVTLGMGANCLYLLLRVGTTLLGSQAVADSGHASDEETMTPETPTPGAADGAVSGEDEGDMPDPKDAGAKSLPEPTAALAGPGRGGSRRRKRCASPGIVVHRTEDSAALPQHLEEDEKELQQRLSMEEMRRDQERTAVPAW